MDKQGLQAGESRWQNFSRSKSKKQIENETKIWIGKDTFETRIRLKIRLKNSRKILG